MIVYDGLSFNESFKEIKLLVFSKNVRITSDVIKAIKMIRQAGELNHLHV